MRKNRVGTADPIDSGRHFRVIHEVFFFCIRGSLWKDVRIEFSRFFWSSEYQLLRKSGPLKKQKRPMCTRSAWVEENSWIVYSNSWEMINFLSQPGKSTLNLKSEFQKTFIGIQEIIFYIFRKKPARKVKYSPPPIPPPPHNSPSALLPIPLIYTSRKKSHSEIHYTNIELHRPQTAGKRYLIYQGILTFSF